MSLRPSRIPICLTLEPIPDESLISYVFRLARYRHLSSAYALWTDCGLQKFSNQPSMKGLAALAASASMDVDRLKAISHGPPDRVGAVVLGRRVRQSVVEDRGKAHRRICPACLSESAYHRVMWDLRYVAVCPVHRCVLVDTCPACAKPLKWVGSDLARCRCGQRLDLDGVEPAPVAPQDTEPTAAVFGLFGDVRFQKEAAAVRNILPLSDLRGEEVAEFLFRLGLERMGRVKKVFSSEDLGELAWQAHVVLRRGLEALEPWPDGFHRTLDDMRLRWGRDPVMSLRICTVGVERWLGGQPEGNGKHIREAVDAYRARHAPGRNRKARCPT